VSEPTEQAADEAERERSEERRGPGGDRRGEEDRDMAVICAVFDANR